jgi:hypothetical protein
VATVVSTLPGPSRSASCYARRLSASTGRPAITSQAAVPDQLRTMWLCDTRCAEPVVWSIPMTGSGRSLEVSGLALPLLTPEISGLHLLSVAQTSLKPQRWSGTHHPARQIECRHSGGVRGYRVLWRGGNMLWCGSAPNSSAGLILSARFLF